MSLLFPRPSGALRSMQPLRRASTLARKQRIVIVGSGWAGFTLLQKLDAHQFEIVVVSPRSYFVFTPLLASTAVGTLEFRCALESVRQKRKSTFHEAWVESVDLDNKTVRCRPALEAEHETLQDFTLAYDKLVLTPGSYSNTFGIPGVHEHAHFLKSAEDARRIRTSILRCFELASTPTLSDTERRRLLMFCIVGGGPTGVEFAAELHDLVSLNLSKLYPSLAPLVQIEIFDVAETILASFDAKLAAYAQQRFARDGIKVHTQQSPKRVLADRLVFEDDPSKAVGPLADKPYGMLVWSTGLMASPLVQQLSEQGQADAHSQTKSLLTDEQLRVLQQGKALPDVYALGDCATVHDQTLPATAQVASQKGIYLAEAFNKQSSRAEADAAAFTFKNRGTMAFLGGGSAIVDASKAGGSNGRQGPRISGRAAYIAWKLAYLTMSMSIRNKILIPTYWLLNAVFGRDINRF